MKPTTKVLIKAISKFDTSEEVQLNFPNFYKTIKELPGINYGVTFRYAFPSFVQAIVFTLRIRFSLPIRILNISISRVLTTEKKVVYKYFISVVKTKMTYDYD